MAPLRAHSDRLMARRCFSKTDIPASCGYRVRAVPGSVDGRTMRHLQYRAMLMTARKIAGSSVAGG